jgi:hypothetical protein
MIKLGYKLMSEEHGPTDLVRNIRRAEQAGFELVLSAFAPVGSRIGGRLGHG